MNDEIAAKVSPSRLEVLKRQRFTPAGRSERIALSLNVLKQPQPIHISPEQWRMVVEDAAVEEQY